MKNMNEIRTMLCDEIEKIRTGNSTPANANAIANLTGKILSSIKLELEYAKLANKNPKDSGFIELEEKAKA